MNNEQDYVAYHGFAFLKGCSDSHKTGLRIQIVLDHEEDYKDFKEFRKHRKGKAGTGLYNCMSKAKDSKAWYGPIQLKFIRWSISSSSGAVVTFEMDDYEEWRKMRDAPALDLGYEQHQLNMMEFMLVELDQEGKAVNVKQKAKMEQMALKRKWPKGGPQSIRAARLCNHTDFLQWLSQRGVMPTAEATPADVAAWLRNECEIDSRKQLDHDPAALERFEARVMRPFLRSIMT